MKAFYLCATNFGVMSYKLTFCNMATDDNFIITKVDKDKKQYLPL